VLSLLYFLAPKPIKTGKGLCADDNFVLVASIVSFGAAGKFS
jgi:hypothetical protein